MPNWQQGRRAFACLVLFATAGAAGAATKVTVNSPSGETLLGGVGARTYNSVVAELAPDAVRIHAGGSAGEFLFIELRAPEGQPLLEGSYASAEMIDQVTGLSPGMRVIANSGGCSDAWGSFNIRQLAPSAVDPGMAGKLEATFVYRCGSATTPALTGTVLVDAGPRSFSYSRDAGFPMGAKPSMSYFGDTGDTDLVLAHQKAFEVLASGQRYEWLFGFEAPSGRIFAKGIYPLSHTADETHARVWAIDNHDGFCADPAGSLNIRNVAYDAEGAMTAVYATWTLTCDGQPAAFRGTFHHDL